MSEPITVIPAPRQWTLEQNEEIKKRVYALKQFSLPIQLVLTELEEIVGTQGRLTINNIIKQFQEKSKKTEQQTK